MELHSTQLSWESRFSQVAKSAGHLLAHVLQQCSGDEPHAQATVWEAMASHSNETITCFERVMFDKPSILTAAMCARIFTVCISLFDLRRKNVQETFVFFMLLLFISRLLV